MKVLRDLTQKFFLCAVGNLLVGVSLSGALPVAAQSRFSLNLPDLEAPGNRESGSTRSNTCLDPEDNLIALVPETNYGLTQSGYPEVYAYLPENTAHLARFILYSETSGQTLYEAQFGITGQSGIVGISLPDNGIQKPLEVGETYRWYLTLVCDSAAIDQSGNAVVTATITRVASPDSIGQAPLGERPAAYAEAGLWYDALATSASLRAQNDPALWNFLLDAVELETLTPRTVLSEGGTSPMTASVQ